MIRRRFPKEQKQHIVEEALSGEISKTAVARKHMISPTVLSRWIDAYENGRLKNTPDNCKRQGNVYQRAPASRRINAKGVRTDGTTKEHLLLPAAYDAGRTTV